MTVTSEPTKVEREVWAEHILGPELERGLYRCERCQHQAFSEPSSARGSAVYHRGKVWTEHTPDASVLRCDWKPRKKRQ